MSESQPPSGGCVLKHFRSPICLTPSAQPPSGGWVLKQFVPLRHCLYSDQPPSGSCVLKRATTEATRFTATSRLRAAVC